MAVEERIFYTSENGDEWLLIDVGDTVAVRHRPNASSGGEAQTIDLAEFLMSERHSAQNKALHKLIATLTHAPPSESSEEVLNSIRSRD